jgi:hypothetical protein
MNSVQIKLKRIGGEDADAMDADVKLAIDSLNFSDSAPHMKGSTTAAAISAAGGEASGRGTGDVDMEDRSGGAGDMDSSGPGGVDAAHNAHRLQAITDEIRKLLADQGLPTDTVMCVSTRFVPFDADMHAKAT